MWRAMADVGRPVGFLALNPRPRRTPSAQAVWKAAPSPVGTAGQQGQAQVLRHTRLIPLPSLQPPKPLHLVRGDRASGEGQGWGSCGGPWPQRQAQGRGSSPVPHAPSFTPFRFSLSKPAAGPWPHGGGLGGLGALAARLPQPRPRRGGGQGGVPCPTSRLELSSQLCCPMLRGFRKSLNDDMGTLPHEGPPASTALNLNRGLSLSKFLGRN